MHYKKTVSRCDTCDFLVRARGDEGTDCHVQHADEGIPDRTTPIGKMINNYLSGATDAEDHVIHLLFSANRWEAA
jgi:dTMP kinase